MTKPIFLLQHRFTKALFLLIVLILAFGLRIPSLGIYQDDWVFVYTMYSRGVLGLKEFMLGDGTPFAGLINGLLFQLLGLKPLYWHIASLLARWFTVVAFWRVLEEIWPDYLMEVFLVAMVFAVHPFFILQPMAFTYLHVWLGYFFLGLSFYWMLRAVQQDDRFWWLMFLSLVAGTATMITLEYFAGVELLVRPILLWIVYHNQTDGLKRKILNVLKAWAPFLLMFTIYAWWRFFIFEMPGTDRNNPVGINMLLSAPADGLRAIVSNLIPDTLLITINAWFKLLEPANFNVIDRRNLLFTVLIVFSCMIVYAFLRCQKNNKVRDYEQSNTWSLGAFWLGLAIVIFGLIPPYVGGLYINEKNALWNSRLGMASMLGASLIIVAVLEWLSPRKNIKYFVLALLIGLSVGYHARYVNDFRWSWRKQENLYRQLLLRIPNIEPGTTIIAPGEILYYMGEYPTAFAINAIYDDRQNHQNEIDNWFFSLTGGFPSDPLWDEGGLPLTVNRAGLTFNGSTAKNLMISFEPEAGECLYVIRPEDKNFRFFHPFIRESAYLSNIDLIDTDTGAYRPFLETIGSNYPVDWCTYYTQADLARQQEDWVKITKLWENAQVEDLRPYVYYEYFVFLEGFYHQRQEMDAVEISKKMLARFPVSRLALCDYWSDFPPSPERDRIIEELSTKLTCFSE